MKEMNRKMDFLYRYHAHTWNSEDEYEQYMGEFLFYFFETKRNRDLGSFLGLNWFMPLNNTDLLTIRPRLCLELFQSQGQRLTLKPL